MSAATAAAPTPVQWPRVRAWKGILDDAIKLLPLYCPGIEGWIALRFIQEMGGAVAHESHRRDWIPASEAEIGDWGRCE